MHLHQVLRHLPRGAVIICPDRDASLHRGADRHRRNPGFDDALLQSPDRVCVHDLVRLYDNRVISSHIRKIIDLVSGFAPSAVQGKRKAVEHLHRYVRMLLQILLYGMQRDTDQFPVPVSGIIRDIDSFIPHNEPCSKYHPRTADDPGAGLMSVCHVCPKSLKRLCGLLQLRP